MMNKYRGKSALLARFGGKLLYKLIWVSLALIALMFYLWSIPALYFTLPWEWLGIVASVVFAIGAPAALVKSKARRKTFFIIFIAAIAITTWQQSIRPTNKRDWKTSVARLPEITINGNEVKIKNIRNFDYRTTTDFTPRYYTRTFKLNELKTLDYILSYWDGHKAIAHTIFSFGFKNGDYLAVSVETRLSKTQTQSLLGGIFNQYELIYVLADERDLIRLRTNFRKEEVFLYRVRVSPQALKKAFIKIVKRAAELHTRPRFYNTVKQNCLTTLLADLSTAQGKKYHFDFRFVMNGYSDALLYQKGILVTGGLPFDKLKKLRHLNQYVGNDPDAASNFSKKIRIPGTGIQDTAPALQKTTGQQDIGFSE
jgi:hypothetical protein